MQVPLASWVTRPRQLDTVLGRLGDVEIRVVRGAAAGLTRRGPRTMALAANWLADGWVYGIIGVGLVVSHGTHARPTITAMVLSMIGSHLLYPVLKSYVARPRPFECDPALSCVTRPLDRFSFPSGHCMTAAAALFPVAFAYPVALPAVVIYSAAVAWARLALAHHYPSDVLAGALLGLAVSVAVTYGVYP